MEHHIAQSSPISPRQKGMEGSRQALLYGVYDAFAGARSLISRRLCALITAIGIAVFTISSSAWATHNPDNPGPPITAGTTPFEVVDPSDDTTEVGDIRDGAVHSEEIGDGEVGEVDLADGAVTGGPGGKILDGSITSDDLKSYDPDTSAGTPDERAGAVTTNKINPGAVTSDKIGAGEVCGSVDTAASTTCETGSNNHIGEGSIGETDLADGEVTNAKLRQVNDPTNPDPMTRPGLDGAVDTNNINTNAIDSRTIATGAVGNDELAPDAVQGGNIGAGEVCGSVATAECTTPMEADINAGSIGTDDIADETVTGSGDDTTTMGDIASETITENEIRDGAVRSEEIADGTITSADLKSVDDGLGGTTAGENGAVTTDKITDGAVTTRKIDNEAVNSLKIADGTVTGSTGNTVGDIAENTITANDIATGGVETDEILDGTVTGGDGIGPNGGDIAQGTITSGNIEDGTIRGGTGGGLGGSGGDIAQGTITGGNIMDNTITEDDIGNNAVGGGELQEEVVCGSGNDVSCGPAGSARTHIKFESIGTNDLADQAVETGKLKKIDDQGRNGAVNSDNINDGAITFRKIGRDAVGSIHIQEGAVRGNHIDDGQIGLRHLGTDVNNVFRRIEGAIDRLDEGIAMSHAISMIKVPQGKEFGISFAGGFYQDKQAAAIGVGFRPTDGLLLSAGASYGFDSEEVGGAVSINFGF